ncbi:MAG: SEC59/DGK1/VTE5 family protein [Candidatus Eisenbacteria bacterium]|nr:SEC59/DGK1/VTE5 family protein [Candidatus Eisenbacteria bacterium]
MSLIAEAKRKAIHFATSWVPLAYYIIPEEAGKVALLAAATVILTLDVLRLHEPRMKNLFHRFFGELVREHERDTLLGATSLVISGLLTAYCFEKSIVVASLLFLTVGDTTAAMIGKTYGRTPIFGKTFEGSLACFLSCLVMAMVVPGIPLFVGIAGALTATFFELLPIPIDDNFRIPLAAGFMMQFLMPH